MSDQKIRVRKEIRSLTRSEWSKVVQSMWIMKTIPDSIGKRRFGPNYLSYDTLVAKHAHAALDKRGDQAHFAPVFPIYHRAWLLLFENSLLSVDPTIPGLPYWDFSKDNIQPQNIPSTTSQSIFSPRYLGSLMGVPPFYEITDGSFAYWPIRNVSKPSSDSFLSLLNVRSSSSSISVAYRFPSPYNLLRHPLSVNPSPFLTRNGLSFCGMKNIFGGFGQSHGWEKCSGSLTSSSSSTPPLPLPRSVSEWVGCMDSLVHGPAHLSVAGSWPVPSSYNPSVSRTGSTGVTGGTSMSCGQWFGFIPPPTSSSSSSPSSSSTSKTPKFLGSFLSAYSAECFSCPTCGSLPASSYSLPASSYSLSTSSSSSSFSSSLLSHLSRSPPSQCQCTPKNTPPSSSSLPTCGPLWTALREEVKKNNESLSSSSQYKVPLVPSSLIHILGDFSDPVTSPNDPIFPFHHANLDRSFQLWIINRMKSDPSLPSRYFDFPTSRYASGGNLHDILSSTDPLVGVFPPPFNTTRVGRPYRVQDVLSGCLKMMNIEGVGGGGGSDNDCPYRYDSLLLASSSSPSTSTSSSSASSLLFNRVLLDNGKNDNESLPPLSPSLPPFPSSPSSPPPVSSSSPPHSDSTSSTSSTLSTSFPFPVNLNSVVLSSSLSSPSLPSSSLSPLSSTSFPSNSPSFSPTSSSSFSLSKSQKSNHNNDNNNNHDNETRDDNEKEEIRKEGGIEGEGEGEGLEYSWDDEVDDDDGEGERWEEEEEREEEERLYQEEDMRIKQENNEEKENEKEKDKEKGKGNDNNNNLFSMNDDDDIEIFYSNFLSNISLSPSLSPSSTLDSYSPTFFPSSFPTLSLPPSLSPSLPLPLSSSDLSSSPSLSPSLPPTSFPSLFLSSTPSPTLFSLSFPFSPPLPPSTSSSSSSSSNSSTTYSDPVLHSFVLGLFFLFIILTGLHFSHRYRLLNSPSTPTIDSTSTSSSSTNSSPLSLRNTHTTTSSHSPSLSPSLSTSPSSSSPSFTFVGRFLNLFSPLKLTQREGGEGGREIRRRRDKIRIMRGEVGDGDQESESLLMTREENEDEEREKEGEGEEIEGEGIGLLSMQLTQEELEEGRSEVALGSIEYNHNEAFEGVFASKNELMKSVQSKSSNKDPQTIPARKEDPIHKQSLARRERNAKLASDKSFRKAEFEKTVHDLTKSHEESHENHLKQVTEHTTRLNANFKRSQSEESLLPPPATPLIQPAPSMFYVASHCQSLGGDYYPLSGYFYPLNYCFTSPSGSYKYISFDVALSTIYYSSVDCSGPIYYYSNSSSYPTTPCGPSNSYYSSSVVSAANVPTGLITSYYTQNSTYAYQCSQPESYGFQVNYFEFSGCSSSFRTVCSTNVLTGEVISTYSSYSSDTCQGTPFYSSPSTYTQTTCGTRSYYTYSCTSSTVDFNNFNSQMSFLPKSPSVMSSTQKYYVVTESYYNSYTNSTNFQSGYFYPLEVCVPYFYSHSPSSEQLMVTDQDGYLALYVIYYSSADCSGPISGTYFVTKFPNTPKAAPHSYFSAVVEELPQGLLMYNMMFNVTSSKYFCPVPSSASFQQGCFSYGTSSEKYQCGFDQSDHQNLLELQL